MTFTNTNLGQRAFACVAALFTSWMLVSAAIGPVLPVA
jgi:hypothetical protein